jgi:hypothetical protein
VSDRSFRFPGTLEVLLALVVVLELLAPFVSRTYGVDGGYHLSWIGEFTNLVGRGVYVPRWIPEAYSGFGAPSFYFYPPLTYYIASGFRALTGVTDAKILFQLTGLFATVASFFSVRMLLGGLGSRRYQKNIAALLYAFAPLRIAELYSRSNLSVHVGYIFLPLVWYGIVLIVHAQQEDRIRGILIFTVSISLLALTNVPLLFVTLTGIAIAAILFYKRITRTIIAEVAISGLIVILLTAFHYFTVLSFMQDSSITGLLVVRPDYLVADMLHGRNIPAAYYIFLIFAAVVMIAIAFRMERRPHSGIETQERTVVLIGLALAAFIIFLGIPVISVPFWRFLPPLPLIQDSWRFYSYGLLFVVVMLAIASSPMMRKASLAIVWMWAIGALVPILLVTFHVHLYQHFERPSGVATEYLTNNAVSRDSVVSTMKRHENDAPALAVLFENERLELTGQSPTSDTLDVSLHSPRRIAYHRFYWPAWHLYVNGQELGNWPDSIGRATAYLPAGTYQAHWELERSPLELAGLWVSGLAATGIIGIAVVWRMRKGFKKGAQS